MNDIKFRLATVDDLNEIMPLIKRTQRNFRDQKIDQWQDNYPDIHVIKNDISRNNSYVLLKDDKVVGIAALYFEDSQVFRQIYNGQWLNNSLYSSIQRLAVDEKYKGIEIASRIIKEIESLSINNKVKSIRVTTHKNNIAMQNFLNKHQFTQKGIVYLNGDSERLAYEKLID